MSESPCMGVAKCVKDQCNCPSTDQYVDFNSLQCVDGCVGIKNGVCTGPNQYQCFESRVTVNTPCDSCAEGFKAIAGDCLSSMGYNAVVAAIVIGIILVLVIAGGAVLFWMIRDKKKKQGMLYDKLSPDSVQPDLKDVETDANLGYEQF